MFRRIYLDLLIPKPQFTWAQSGTQQPPPTLKKMGETSKRILLGLPDHFYRICLAFAVKKNYFLNIF